jgi:hypothetical protein
VQHRTQPHPHLFTYRTEVSLRRRAPFPRVWPRWLLLALALASTAALMLGVLYWLATFDVNAALHALGGLPGLVAGPG